MEADKRRRTSVQHVTERSVSHDDLTHHRTGSGGTRTLKTCHFIILYHFHNAPPSFPSIQRPMSSSLPKSSLTLALTEPLVVLRTVDIAGARPLPVGVTPPSTLRGLLALDLSKPTRVSSIQVELQAVSYSSWSEGVFNAHSPFEFF
jgi:hypothetical protein